MNRFMMWVPVLLLAPVMATAFPIDVNMTSKGLDVEYQATPMELTTAVMLQNYESFPVRCSVRFTNGPELSRTRRVTIEGENHSTVQFTARRAIVRLRVDINCERVED